MVDDLKRVEGGFSRVVSAGKRIDPKTGKPCQRIQFRLRICTSDKQLARARLKDLLAMRDALVAAGRGPEAEYLLTQAGQVAHDAELFARAVAMAGRVIEAPLPVVERTFETWGELARGWSDGDLPRLFPDANLKEKNSERDSQRIDHLEQFIGQVPLAAFDKTHYRHALQNLPDRCKAQGTRRAYGQIVLKVMRIAKAVDLIEVNPLDGIEAPKVDKDKSPVFTCLYPDEFYRLLACELVPFEYRVLWGFMCLESPRIGRLRLLRWSDIERDNETGALSIDSKSGEMLHWVLAPGTLEALDELHRRMPHLDGPFAWLTESAVNKAAKTLQAHLGLAGCNRSRLRENDGRRRKLRAHDTRATFIVNALRNGRNEKWIMARTGHTTSAMVHKYDRFLEVATEKQWQPLGRLDEALGLEKADRDTSRDSADPLRTLDTFAEVETPMISTLVAPAGFEPARLAARDFKDLGETPEDTKPAQFGRRDAPESVGTAGPSQSSVTPARGSRATLLDQLRAAAHAAVEAGNWGTVQSLGALIDAEEKRLSAHAPVSLEVVRAKREGGK